MDGGELLIGGMNMVKVGEIKVRNVREGGSGENFLFEMCKVLCWSW